LHLDKRWLEIHLEGGGAQRCETPEDVLDDVVGPMVNKNVKIAGFWSRKRGNRRFFLDDIELA
jgi:hypothetical protein